MDHALDPGPRWRAFSRNTCSLQLVPREGQALGILPGLQGHRSLCRVTVAPKAFLEEGRDMVRNKLPCTLTPSLRSCHNILPERERFTPGVGVHRSPSWPEADLMGSRGWDEVSVLCVEGQDQQAGGRCRGGARRVRKQPEQSLGAGLHVAYSGARKKAVFHL